MNNRKTIIIATALLLTLVIGFGAHVVIKDHYAKRDSGVCRTIDSKRICLGALVGLSEKDAIELAENEGFNPAVVQRDGKNILRTLEGDPLRVDLWVESDTVVGAEFAK